MTPPEDRIVLAVECGHCCQITPVSVYNDALYIVRCGNCGRTFAAAEALVHQYQTFAERIAQYDRLRRTLQAMRAAMTTALEQWGRKAGREALVQALNINIGQESATSQPGG